MFKESIFEGACATSTAEVLLIIAGSLALGLLLGYLIWGWLRKKVNELETKVIELSRAVKEQELAIGELTDENQALSDELSRSKREFDLKSTQYSSAISRIRTLEENESGEGDKKEINKLVDQIRSQKSKISELEDSLKSVQKSTASLSASALKATQKVATKPTAAKRGRPKKSVTTSDTPPVEKPKAKRGRPKKVATAVTSIAPPKRRGRPKKEVKPKETGSEAPKRKRGRPRKDVSTPTAVKTLKRKPGRPKKTEPVVEVTKKAKRGRPRKIDVQAITAPPKKKRGRPKKAKAEAVVVPPKRKRGRPKKVETTAAAVAPQKRKRGRPKKIETAAVVTPPKRKRGRPKKIGVASAVATSKPERGRPKKSETVSKTPAPARRRGRPKGSKNKPKTFSGTGIISSASEVFGKRIRQDDLTLIEGIGPKISNLFKKNNLDTWEKISNANQSSLKETIEKIGPRHHIHDPKTWPRQARMATKGEWKKLKVYQDTLIRGKK